MVMSLASLSYGWPALIFAQFLIIPCFLAARTGLRGAVLCICLMAAVLAAIFMFFGINPVACALTLLTLASTPFSVKLLDEQFHCRKSMVEKELKDIKMDYANIQDNMQAVDVYNATMEQRLNETMSLYEMTKGMSSSLVFAEIFKTLNNFMKEKFIFRKVKLILVDHKDGATPIMKGYQITGQQSIEDLPVQAEIEETELKLLAYFTKESKEPLLLTAPEHDARMKDFSLQLYLRTFMAIPLLIENKIVGILAGEDFPAESLEKFVILAEEFALEIKKVLLYETVQSMAIMDGLTNIYVRRHFLERFDEELKRARGHGLELTFMIVDVDNFKSYNDTYGHLVGDAVLKEISSIIKSNIREIDLVGRYGGEEFALILSETSKETAYQVGERIRQIIENNKFKAYDEVLKLTISIGISGYPADGDARDSLIDKADMALYEAKRKGKNSAIIYTPDLGMFD